LTEEQRQALIRKLDSTWLEWDLTGDYVIAYHGTAEQYKYDLVTGYAESYTEIMSYYPNVLRVATQHALRRPDRR